MNVDQWPNLATMFFEQAATYREQPFLWKKRDGVYESLTWSDANARAIALARGLLSLGVQSGDRIVLVSENRPAWPIADIAIMAAGGITTPAYTTNTPADHRHVLTDSGARGAIVSTTKLAEKVLAGADGIDHVEFVIVMEDLPKHSGGPKVLRMADILETGQARHENVYKMAEQINRADTACIIYTSGTGGTPKGVMLSHGSILHNCAGAVDALRDLKLEREIFLSFLPLSHSYEHTAGQFFPIAIGGEIYYAEGVESLSANMLEARPTIMTAVPRLYEVLHQRIILGVEKSGGLKRAMFEKTLSLGKKHYHDGKLGLVDCAQDRILDKLVRDKVRARFGGRLKALVSGGAPLNPDIGLFFTALGLRILQGYGQTESAPVISVNRAPDARLHTVGRPLPDTEVKIAGDGEICVRGELVMQGYWNNDEATGEAIKDGWLHTGDVGNFDNNGHLMITDRKKDIIVNSGGDNIAPQRVEGILIAEPELSQAMVYGDKRPNLVAVVVPDEGWLTEWKRANKKKGDLSDLASDKELHNALAPAFGRVNKSLSNIEKVRRFIIASEPFSVDNEQLTPTMKVRRHIVKAVYGDRLEALYKS
ncbi:MAG: long-chain fatty acid--CoA ligase [Rhodospirillales bacterium]|nr:long-chain fatty acid--CoA ligase [Rhodospirillales bacterium]